LDGGLWHDHLGGRLYGPVKGGDRYDYGDEPSGCEHVGVREGYGFGSILAIDAVVPSVELVVG
jgi:hypothetical protein